MNPIERLANRLGLPVCHTSRLLACWNREACRLTPERSALEGIWELSLEDLISQPLLHIPYLLLFAQGKLVPTEKYTADRVVYGQRIRGHIELAGVRSLVSAGATCLFNAAEEWVPPIRKYVGPLGADSGQVVNAGLFYTPAGATGLTWHRDAQHIVAIQVLGSKAWEVEWWPRGGDLKEERLPSGYRPASEDYRRLRLDQGEALYLPPGAAHQPRALRDVASLHLTVGILPGNHAACRVSA